MKASMVARAIGVAPATLIRWEKYPNRVKFKNLEKLAHFYGISMEELLNDVQ